MTVMKSIFTFIAECIQNILWHIKLCWLDHRFYSDPFRDKFDYPPSFYLTHTPEEVAAKKKADLDELREMLEEYDRKNGIKPKDSNNTSSKKDLSESLH